MFIVFFNFLEMFRGEDEARMRFDPNSCLNFQTGSLPPAPNENYEIATMLFK
jgi:hypothetical protein